jgi:hypothetical protein
MLVRVRQRVVSRNLVGQLADAPGRVLLHAANHSYPAGQLDGISHGAHPVT